MAIKYFWVSQFGDCKHIFKDGPGEVGYKNYPLWFDWKTVVGAINLNQNQYISFFLLLLISVC